jgi:hypothetical protein
LNPEHQDQRQSDFCLAIHANSAETKVV